MTKYCRCGKEWNTDCALLALTKPFIVDFTQVSINYLKSLKTLDEKMNYVKQFNYKSEGHYLIDNNREAHKTTIINDYYQNDYK